MNRFFGYARILDTLIQTTGVTPGPPVSGQFPGIACRVFNAGSSVSASIYADTGGTVFYPNPFSVNADGGFTFYAPNSTYDLLFSASVLTPIIHDVQVPTYVAATLPPPDSVLAGRLARRTDAAPVLWMDDGASWVGVNGIGISSYAVGDLLVASSPTALSRLAVGAAGTVLVGGSTPSYSANPVVTSVRVNGAILTSATQGFAQIGNQLTFDQGSGYYSSGFSFPTAAGVGFTVGAGGVVTASGAVVVGTNPATTGAIRLANNTSLYFRDAANSADVQGLFFASDNGLYVGAAALRPLSDNSIPLGHPSFRWSEGHFGSFLVVGPNPAAVGDIRLGKDGIQIQKRRADNLADLNLISGHLIDANDVIVGSSSGPLRWKSNLATPGSLADGDAWIEATGTSPSRVAAIKLRDGGVTRTIASVTY